MKTMCIVRRFEIIYIYIYIYIYIIYSSIIKATFHENVNPLTFIFNVSLSTGIVPDILKMAEVVPIHKSDDKGLVNNYRPISVLPLI